MAKHDNFENNIVHKLINYQSNQTCCCLLEFIKSLNMILQQFDASKQMWETLVYYLQLKGVCTKFAYWFEMV